MTIRKAYMSYLFAMSAANVSLSAEELALVGNTEWVRMKQGIIQKVYEMFAASVEDIDQSFSSTGVDGIYGPERIAPKISKGENYLGLPYVMLDYPRDFGREDVFSLRTFFWWGNFFSISMHLSGRYSQIFLSRFDEGKKIPDGLHYCVHETPWQHYFERDNLKPFMPGRENGCMEEIMKHTFLKWVIRYDLGNWNQMPRLLREGYRQMAEWLA